MNEPVTNHDKNKAGGSEYQGLSSAKGHSHAHGQGAAMSANNAGWTLQLEELVAATGGRVLSQHARAFHGVGTDTRVALDGKIFVALKGDVYDAHDFLEKAVEAKAAALLVHRLPANAQALLQNVTVIEVKDTLTALQHLGNFWRHKMKRASGVKILGVTGTNGKTTTKEFAAAILGSKFSVQYSKGSFNNHWGVPISLLSIAPEHQVAVIEMGMNHPGELTVLSKIAEPDSVVVTMVGRGHLEGVGSIEGAAKAKAEIYEQAPPHAIRIFNLENEHTHRMYERLGRSLPAAQLITFAGSEYARANKLDVDIALEVIEATPVSLKITGSIRGVKGMVEVPVFGRHNVTNLMTAAAMGLVCGMSPEEIWSAFPLCKTAWGRNQWVDLQCGARALFDAYNANPESMRAAVENFAGLTLTSGGRKIAVLGEMREMGSAAPTVHRELGALCANAGFDTVCFIGPSGADFEAGIKSAGFRNKLVISNSYEQNLASRMLPVLDRNDIVLIKGSRGMQLEKVLADLKPVSFESKK
jgi:UDP-N-acetylmuramoyl-tripeptide--D-alanyl-D-alanine ligase